VKILFKYFINAHAYNLNKHNEPVDKYII